MQVDLNDCSDAELIRAAGADAAAFGVLYERHALRVYTWSRRRLEWAASDLTAETFAQAWFGRHRFRDEQGGSALPWLLGIARNVLRETVRLDRVETRARERLGLPVDLASEDGYAQVDERLSPQLAPRPDRHLPRSDELRMMRVIPQVVLHRCRLGKHGSARSTAISDYLDARLPTSSVP